MKCNIILQIMGMILLIWIFFAIIGIAGVAEYGDGGLIFEYAVEKPLTAIVQTLL